MIARSSVVRWHRVGGSPELLHADEDRDRPVTQHPYQVLWYTGFVANRASLADQLGRAHDLPDTQLLAALYDEYGTDLSQRINGTCSWVLWDGTHRVLVASRDRIGNYGIYYAVRANTVWLASSVEAILGRLLDSPPFNIQSIISFLVQLPPKSGDTFYESIQCVPPATTLSIDPTSISLRRYWRVQARAALRLNADQAYAEAYRSLLFQVVREYAQTSRSGILLSGGLDSTSVAAALRNVAPETEITSFSFRTPELPEADESRLSSAVAAYLHLPNISIRADTHWPLSRGVQTSPAGPLFGHYHELMDATFQLVQSRGIKVLLSGAGGDELFGGGACAYPDLLLTGRWFRLAREIYEHLPHTSMSALKLIRHKVLGPVARAFVPGLRVPPAPPPPWLGARYNDLRRNLTAAAVSSEFRWLLPGRAQRARFLANPFLAQITQAGIARALAYDIEFRHPLLDHRLLEFSARLPSPQTFSAGMNKIVVRNAMRGYLPTEILTRRHKIVPTTIFHRGLREREHSRVQALITNMRSSDLGFVDERRLRVAYSDYVAGKNDDTRFWSAISVEAWLRSLNQTDPNA